MLEIQRIRTERDSIIASLAKRNINVENVIDQIIALDQQWRSNKKELEDISAELNQIARKIGELFQSGQQAAAADLKDKNQLLKSQEAALKTNPIYVQLNNNR